ncbi:MAG: oligoendopeptidase F [Phycisphaerae bacterium]
MASNPWITSRTGAALAAEGSAGAPKALPTRDQLPEQDTWNLADLYVDDAAWNADFAKAEQLVGKAAAHKGTLARGAKELLATLKLRDETYVLVDRLAVFASLRQDENLDDKTHQSRYGRAMDLYNKFSEAWSWFGPEVLQIAEATLADWLSKDAALATYRHALDDMRRLAPHTLSPREEELLAMSGDMSDCMQRTFSLFTNADLKFPTIQDEQKHDVQLSPGRFLAFLNSPDGRVRRDAFLGLHKTYESYENTLGSLLSFQVKKAIFYARARHYASAREAALTPNNIPVAVYDNLITAVHEGLPLLHRYTALRKKLLKLDELHPYDLYVPLVAESHRAVPYDDAVKTILEALGVLGDDYIKPMRQGFAGRWIDVRETRGKRSGAYCSGTYSSHPYLLLNYSDTAHDRSTVAHEMGHAMHTWFTTHAQPVVYGDYAIFCAEVASTVNEVILNEYLYRRATTKAEKLELVNELLENIRTTVFRQTLFAEFEKQIHETAEAGRPLTPDLMQKIYRDLVQKYYGRELVIDPETDSECFRIPHFYRNFYVFQYATSYAAATDIGRRIITKKPGATEGLMKFLKAGSSVYPIDCLKLAGVDMTTPDPVRSCMRLFGEKLDEMEKLLAE